jgi:hypothetical protein
MPGPFAGAKVDDVLDQGVVGNTFAFPAATPASLSTGNVGGIATGVVLKDDWVEFGVRNAGVRVSFDVTTAGRISFRLDVSGGSFIAYTLVLASSSFAGCGIRYNGDSTVLDSSGTAIQTGNPTISADGAVTLTFPNTLAGSATWQLVNCPVSDACTYVWVGRGWWGAQHWRAMFVTDGCVHGCRSRERQHCLLCHAHVPNLNATANSL